MSIGTIYNLLAKKKCNLQSYFCCFILSHTLTSNIYKIYSHLIKPFFYLYEFVCTHILWRFGIIQSD